MATDLGQNENGLFERFLDSDLILIEANYDEEMLNRSPRLDRGRVGSSVGTSRTPRPGSSWCGSSRRAGGRRRPSSCAI